VPLNLSTNPVDGFLYALNEDVETFIYGFSVDAVTGALTALPDFPVATGKNGSAHAVANRMTYDLVKRHLYVLNDGDNTVSAYKVDPNTGALTELTFSPIALPGDDRFYACLAAHPRGTPLLVLGGTTVHSFNITDNSATAASGSPYDSGANALSCGFSTEGTYFYSGGGIDTSKIAGFSVNQDTGVLTALSGSPFETGINKLQAYVTDLDGRLFTASIDSFGTGVVQAFTTISGIPSAVSGDPITSGVDGAVDGVLHPAGFYMVAARVSDDVGVYAIGGSGSSTTLTPVTDSPFASGGDAHQLALNNSGEFLYAANASARTITGFSVNESTGALTSLFTLPANSIGENGRTTGMAFLPTVVYVYLPIVNK
jgi:6-phosphogluconolactonase (cycloisomerase 2 family)